MSPAITLPEPCTRIYLHVPHLIQIVGLNNQVVSLVCQGTEKPAGRGDLADDSRSEG